MSEIIEAGARSRKKNNDEWIEDKETKKTVEKMKKKVGKIRSKVQKSKAQYRESTLFEKIVDLDKDYEQSALDPATYKKYIVSKLKKKKGGYYQKYKDIAPKSFLEEILGLIAEEYKLMYILEFIKISKKYEKKLDRIDIKRLEIMKNAIKERNTLKSRYMNILNYDKPVKNIVKFFIE